MSEPQAGSADPANTDEGAPNAGAAADSEAAHSEGQAAAAPLQPRLDTSSALEDYVADTTTPAPSHCQVYHNLKCIWLAGVDTKRCTAHDVHAVVTVHVVCYPIQGLRSA